MALSFYHYFVHIRKCYKMQQSIVRLRFFFRIAKRSIRTVLLWFPYQAMISINHKLLSVNYANIIKNFEHIEYSHDVSLSLHQNLSLSL